jgi:hypothetical protein
MIQDMGSVVMRDQDAGHKVLTNVYYIPELKNNIVSLGRLEEKGFKYEGGNDKLCVYDQDSKLLISAPRTLNRLYNIKFGLDSRVYLLANSDEKAWQWHARLGDLNFRALHELSGRNMVECMPIVKKIE